MTAAGLAARMVEPFLDFLFPPLCLACSGHCPPGERIFCEHCRRKLEHVSESDHTMSVLAERFREAGTISCFLPLYYFEEHGVLQHAIHALKYEGMTAVGEALGRELGAVLAARPEFAFCDLIIPVPLHSVKERERGYNQSDWICRGVARELRAPIGRRLIRRTRNTRTQTKLSASERIENVQGAFDVEREKTSLLKNKAVLLVDDVVTTGATLGACAFALRQAGADRVVCASVGAAKLTAGAA